MSLDPETVRSGLRGLKGWRVYSKSIVKTYVFKDFLSAIKFVLKIADISEEIDHHPDIYISYNKVRIKCSTRKVDGITTKDIELAKQIESIYRDIDI